MYDAMGRKRRTGLRDRLAQLRAYASKRGEVSVGEVFEVWQLNESYIRYCMRKVAVLPGGYIFDEDRDLLISPKKAAEQEDEGVEQ